ncbi:MAG: hypothetical protein AAB421_00920 [Patescibacteria group bacterium]
MRTPDQAPAPFITVTLATPESRRAHAEQVWQLIVKTYEGYGNSEDGNLYGAEIENLIQTPGLWKLTKKSNEIIAGVVYRSFKGNKVRLVLHNDTRDGKDAMKDIFLSGFAHGNCWGEFSGHLEKILRVAQVPHIPNTQASELLEKPIISLDADGMHYEREVFPDTIKREMLFGAIDTPASTF